MKTSYEEITNEEWWAYLWWHDWDSLWEQIGLAEYEWATLYLPFLPRYLES